MRYEIVFTIVKRGLSQTVIDASNSAGAHGATVVQARGASCEGTDKLFSQPLDPEKEIIMILIDKEKTLGVKEAIEKELKSHQAGKWVLFVTDVNRTTGLFTGKK